MKTCFRSMVENAVLDVGRCTVDRVLAEVGKHIPASKAAVAGRRRQKVRVGCRIPSVDRGRRALVAEALCRLAKQGRIRRVHRGVYAPPLLKLFETA